ncbi:hypothetical protein M5689_018967 [Euphorbia peplus]|nr:hypothetical protein M5689_018967 [Euphorbia peplus]
MKKFSPRPSKDPFEVVHVSKKARSATFVPNIPNIDETTDIYEIPETNEMNRLQERIAILEHENRLIMESRDRISVEYDQYRESMSLKIQKYADEANNMRSMYQFSQRQLESIDHEMRCCREAKVVAEGRSAHAAKALQAIAVRASNVSRDLIRLKAEMVVSNAQEERLYRYLDGLITELDQYGSYA